MLAAPLAAAAFGDDRLTPLIQVLALQFPLNALCPVPQALARRDMNFKWLAWIELVSGLTSSLCTLALAWFGRACGRWCWGLWPEAGCDGPAVARRRSVLPVFRLDGITSSSIRRCNHREPACMAGHLPIGRADRGTPPDAGGRGRVFRRFSARDLADDEDHGHREPGRLSDGGKAPRQAPATPRTIARRKPAADLRERAGGLGDFRGCAGVRKARLRREMGGSRISAPGRELGRTLQDARQHALTMRYRDGQR